MMSNPMARVYDFEPQRGLSSYQGTSREKQMCCLSISHLKDVEPYNGIIGDQMTPEELKTLKAITELARLYMDDYPFQLPIEDVAIVVDAENLLVKYGVK